MILVTGPTGSGKTTTLYAALAQINSVERKLITVEDPIEYRLAGTTQVQVNEKIDLTFSRVLRSARMVVRRRSNAYCIGKKSAPKGGPASRRRPGARPAWNLPCCEIYARWAQGRPCEATDIPNHPC